MTNHAGKNLIECRVETEITQESVLFLINMRIVMIPALQSLKAVPSEGRINHVVQNVIDLVVNLCRSDEARAKFLTVCEDDLFLVPSLVKHVGEKLTFLVTL